MTSQSKKEKSKESIDLALFFYKTIDKPIPKNMAIVVNQTKNLLNRYSFLDLQEAIEYFVYEEPPYGGMYSIGYLFSGMDKYLAEKEHRKRKEEELSIRGDIIEPKTQWDNKSRIREDYNFDGFERPE